MQTYRITANPPRCQRGARCARAVISDDGDTIAAMGRGALRVRVRAGGRDVDVVNCYLKSKLLTFPGGRFHPRDEGERARAGGYALFRRAAEAVTVRAYANELLEGQGGERAVIVLGDLNDVPEAASASAWDPPRLRTRCMPIKGSPRASRPRSAAATLPTALCVDHPLWSK